jgi:hypothetical protein
VFNKSAIDRGIFRVDSLKKYPSKIQKNPSTSQDDIFTKADPNKVAGMKQVNYYNKLNDRGFVPEETEIHNNDIIIGKISPIQPTGNNNKVFKDNSETFKSNVTGVIDKVYTGIYDAEGYEMYDVRVRMERIPIVGDKFCLKKSTDVLTTNGWIKIEDVTKDHLVAILNPEKDTIEYENPSEILCFEYDSEIDGKMYQLKSQLVELTVTPNHRMFIKSNNDKFDFMLAKDCFGQKLKYKKSISNFEPSDWIGDTFIIPENKDKPEIKINMNDWIVIESLKVINNDIGLSDWVWQLNKDQSQLLIDSIILKSDDNLYYTSSEKLVNDLSRLCIHAGWCADFRKIDSLNNWCLSIIKTKLEPEINYTQNGQSEEWIDYKGTVHCLTVRTGIFMVRENGKPVWTGNSNRHG